MIAGTCVPWADTVVIETTDDAFAAVEQIEHCAAHCRPMLETCPPPAVRTPTRSSSFLEK